MKKTLLLTACAALAMTVNAQSIAGSYLSKTMTQNNVNSTTSVTIAEGDDGTYDVTGLLGNKPVKATFDDAQGILSIEPGQVAQTHDTYGDALLYMCTDDSHYSSGTAAQFKLSTDGSLQLTNGVGFIMMLQGDYAGSRLGNKSIGGYEILPVNGTITNNRVNADWSELDVTTFNSAVRADGGEGVIVGVDGFTWVNFTYDDQGTVTVASDSIYLSSSGTYKKATIRRGVASTSTGNFALTTAQATGTIDFEALTLNLGPWCIAQQNASTGSYGIVNGRKGSSVITFTLPQDDPTAINDIKTVKATKVNKYMRDGQLIIERDGIKYNTMGQTIQ